MINPFNNKNQMMINKFNNDLIQYYLYQQRLIQMQKQQQMMQTFKIQQQYLMMQAYMNKFKTNYNNITNNNNVANNNNSEDKLNIKIKFLIVPKDWDKSEKSALIIMPQITLEHTLEKAIDNFFIKLELPRESIAEFKFNDNTLDVKSKQKLSEIGIGHESKILAIKADNFDSFINNKFNK